MSGAILPEVTETDVLWRLPAGGAFVITDETGTELFRVTASGDAVKVEGTTVDPTQQGVLNAITASATELNILDGVTATASEVNVLAGVTAGTAAAGKALVATTNKHVDEIHTAGLYLGAGAGTQVTATAAELNAMDVSAVAAGARTATNDGTGTGAITATGLYTFVTVTSDNADKIITLPAPVAGLIVVLINGNTGYELRTTAPGTIAINGGAEANAESAIAADQVVFMVCASATQWFGWEITGSTLTAVEAAAAA